MSKTIAYTILLTAEDWKTIRFVGTRYSWSSALLWYDTDNILNLKEHEAWEIAEAFKEDTIGDHSPFPMLDTHSELAEKLYTFWDSII